MSAQTPAGQEESRALPWTPSMGPKSAMATLPEAKEEQCVRVLQELAAAHEEARSRETAQEALQVTAERKQCQEQLIANIKAEYAQKLAVERQERQQFEAALQRQNTAQS
ncbi:unnamed protein product [Symbiodinium sp. CCMP2456]|nr:unnamed protein product [Symbiodinium sp. CCMP2456]